MRNFTFQSHSMNHKYIALFLGVFISITSSLYSQSLDLSVEDVHFSSDTLNVVPPGLKSSMAITIRNNDSNAIEPGDSITVGIYIDGAMFVEDIALTSPFAGLSDLTYNFGAGNLFHFTDTGSYYDAFGMLFYANDSNHVNDTLTVTYVTSPFTSNDWSAVAIDMVSPNNLDSFDIDNGTNQPPALDELSVSFQNVGQVTYLQWTAIQYSIVLGSDTTNLEGVLKDSNIAPMGSTVRTLSNQAIMPSLPDSVGTYSLCTVINEAFDVNTGNDEACFVFTIVDLYDPNDPTNWPFGIEDQNKEELKVTALPDMLRFEGVQRNLEVRIFTMQGGLMATEYIQGATTLSTNILAPGMYSVQVIAEDGRVWGSKFVKAF